MNSDALAARIGNLLGSSPSSNGDNIPSRTPPPIPNHEIIARIGGGSYGEVWLARGVTGALRAVKVVWRSRFSSERPYEREFRGIIQFEPLSRSHPAVVNVLHVGRDDAAGCFFYVMELADPVQGSRFKVQSSVAAPSSLNPEHETFNSYVPRTLASVLKSNSRLPVTDVVSLGVQLAGALGHLHRHGLVHRDVKPSNVIFVQGQPKLADIGLVTGVHEERSFVGTEGFIPPEGPGSEQADLFALGRLLYEAVTGNNRCDFPALPGDLDRWPTSEREGLIELNEILARACAPKAEKRHKNAADLAGDLNLILAGRSVRRAYRVERRLRSATLVSALAVVLVFAATFFSWLQRRQRELSDSRTKREITLRERAEAAERESQQQLYAALLEHARATVLTAEVGHRVRALDALRRAGAISNSAALRGVALAALALPDLRLEREWQPEPGTTMANLDPVFERVAFCRTNGPVEIRSVTDQRLLATLPASTNLPAYFGLWSPDGRFFAVSRDRDATASVRDVEVWEVAGARQVLLKRGTPWGAMSFHPRLPQIMIGQPDAAVVWSLETGQEVMRHPLEGKPVALKFSSEGQRFAVLLPSGQQWKIAIHDATNGTAGVHHLFAQRVREFDWHPNGGSLAVPDFSGAVHLMDARTGQARVLGWHKAAAVRTFFSPDGAYLFSSGWDRQLICWNVKAMRRAFAVDVSSYVMQFRRDGNQCAFAVHPEMRLQTHAFERPALCREFDGDLGGGRNYAAFSPDGRWLAAHGDERLAVWDLVGDGPAAIVDEPSNANVTFTPNSELLTSRSGECSRWRIHPGANGAAPALERLPMTRPAGFVSLCVTSNGVVFTSTRASKLVPFDQLASEEGVWKPTVEGLNGTSRDERWLATYRPYASHLYVYRLAGFERVGKLINGGSIGHFEFSPRGEELAVCTRAGTEFWSTTTWQRTRHLTNFTKLLYSPDTPTFWAAKDYRTSGLHDARTAELLFPLPPDSLPLAVSPDGRRLAVSVHLRYVQVWDLPEIRLQLRELGLDWQ